MNNTSKACITDAIDELKRYDAAYYGSGDSQVSDAHYDALKDRAKAEFPTHPYFSTVGAAEPDHLSKVELRIHMGSQNKATSVQDMQEWVKKGSGTKLITEKIDGSSAELIYNGGKLVRAATRGDGVYGSDITMNARKWANIPQEISFKGELVIRGEAVLLIHSWKTHFQGTANPRNAGNGTVLRKDGEKNEHIHFFAFDSSLDAKYQHEKLEHLQQIGFDTVKWFYASYLDDLQKVHDRYSNTRSSLPYEVDGLVVSFDDLEVQKELGFSDGGTRPKGQIAWKFESIGAETTVTGFEITQGQTGNIIPTMKVAPVQIGGVIVSSVLVNNFFFVQDHNVNVGDRVEIIRRGDVIPYLEKVIEKKSEGCFKPPSACPSCNGPLSIEGRYHLCKSDQCEGRVYQRVKNWINKLNILHLGDNLLDALFEAGYVKNIQHLYGLTPDILAPLRVGNGVLGQSMAEKVVAEIKKTESISIDLFIGSLGIKFLGRSMARHIGFDTINEYLTASIDKLASCENMGVNKAAEMRTSIQKRRSLIETLAMIINVEPLKKVKEAKMGGFAQQSFCLTGVRMTAQEKKKFEEWGGVEKSGVSAGLNYLVQKSINSVSSKTEKAKKLGITVISYADFQAMLNSFG